MKRAFLAIAAVLFAAQHAAAVYEPTYFGELAGASNVIASGTIVAVDEETYALAVEDSIAGAVKAGEVITVERFHDWACAWRWGQYEAGQRVLVFLNAEDGAKPPRYRIRGAGCEGESPIVDKDVYVNCFVPGKTLEYGKLDFTPVSYKLFRSAIVDFRESYRLTPSHDPWKTVGNKSVYLPIERIAKIPTTPPKGEFRPRPTRDNRRNAIPFQQRSSLHKHLVDWAQFEQQRIAEYRQQKP